MIKYLFTVTLLLMTGCIVVLEPNDSHSYDDSYSYNDSYYGGSSYGTYELQIDAAGVYCEDYVGYSIWGVWADVYAYYGINEVYVYPTTMGEWTRVRLFPDYYYHNHFYT